MKKIKILFFLAAAGSLLACCQAQAAGLDPLGPVLTITGVTDNGHDLPGNQANGFTLALGGDATLIHHLQLKAGSIVNQPLSSETIRLNLQPSGSNTSDLLAFNQGKSGRDKEYYDGQAVGTQPFMYLDYRNDNSVGIIDGPSLWLNWDRVDVAIPDNYPTGTFLAGNSVMGDSGYFGDIAIKLIMVAGLNPPTITINNSTVGYARSHSISASTDKGILSMATVASGSDVCDNSLAFVDYAPVNYSSPADAGKKICYRSVDAGGTAYKLSAAVDNILAETEDVPDSAGVATSTQAHPRIIAEGAFSSLNISVDDGVADPSVYYGQASGGRLVISPSTAVAVNGIKVTIPSGVTVASDDPAWSGTLSLPRVATATLPDDPTQTKTLVKAFELGFAGSRLSFDKGVRLAFPGQAGNRVGYSHAGGSLTEITAICSADNQATGDALAAGADCKLDSGADLVVWTKHFSNYAIYTQTAKEVAVTPAGGGGSGGGGGGGGAVVSTPTGVTIGGLGLPLPGLVATGTAATSSASVATGTPVKIQPQVLGVKILTPAQSRAALLKRLSGRVITDAKNSKTVWYVNPKNKQRYSISNNAEAIKVLELAGKGIDETALNKIQAAGGKTKVKADAKLLARLGNGLYLLIKGPHAHGQGWLIKDGLRYGVDKKLAYRVLRSQVITVSKIDLSNVKPAKTK